MFKPDRLKKCREEKSLSQTDLTFELDKIGLRVTRPTIDNWEAGSTAPDANEISIIAKFFNKPIEYFFAH
jgi:transcriptional regulator with XRE-family HTH domain